MIAPERVIYVLGTVISSWVIIWFTFIPFITLQLVRLVRDININETDSFCRSNITLSDYIPDSTGTLSGLKQQLCMIDKVELYRELPPLLFASQVRSAGWNKPAVSFSLVDVSLILNSGTTVFFA